MQVASMLAVKGPSRGRGNTGAHHACRNPASLRTSLPSLSQAALSAPADAAADQLPSTLPGLEPRASRERKHHHPRSGVAQDLGGALPGRLGRA